MAGTKATSEESVESSEWETDEHARSRNKQERAHESGQAEVESRGPASAGGEEPQTCAPAQSECEFEYGQKRQGSVDDLLVTFILSVTLYWRWPNFWLWMVHVRGGCWRLRKVVSLSLVVSHRRLAHFSFVRSYFVLSMGVYVSWLLVISSRLFGVLDGWMSGFRSADASV